MKIEIIIFIFFANRKGICPILLGLGYLHCHKSRNYLLKRNCDISLHAKITKYSIVFLI